ncbi:uncharacterized protein LOC120652344 isoform X3 [Panicum virgatum]|nr:uncharacterized protein LOC120652344 isoform X3 [Panicum virgatum]
MGAIEMWRNSGEEEGYCALLPCKNLSLLSDTECLGISLSISMPLFKLVLAACRDDFEDNGRKLFASIIWLKHLRTAETFVSFQSCKKSSPVPGSSHLSVVWRRV